MRESRAFAVIVLGKYSLMREGISRILQAQNFRILASVSSVDQIKCRVRPQNIVFLIVYTNDDFDLVVTEVELLRDQYPDAHVAVVADHYGPGEPALAFKAGAAGYLVSASSCDAFVKSVELVMLGETVFPPSFPSAPAGRKPRRPRGAPVPREDEKTLPYASPENAAIPLLSPRERAILRCLVEGDSNKTIARKIDIAEATVKAHIKAILRKIRVQNRTQAAIWGIHNALLLQPANNNSLIALAEMEKAPSGSSVGTFQL